MYLFLSHTSQVDIKCLYADCAYNSGGPRASQFLTVIQVGDSAMAESLLLVPGYQHTTAQQHLEM